MKKAQITSITQMFELILGGVLGVTLILLLTRAHVSITQISNENENERHAITFANMFTSNPAVAYYDGSKFHRDVLDKEKLDKGMISRGDFTGNWLENIASLPKKLIFTLRLSNEFSYPDSYALIIVSDVEKSEVPEEGKGIFGIGSGSFLGTGVSGEGRIGEGLGGLISNVLNKGELKFGTELPNKDKLSIRINTDLADGFLKVIYSTINDRMGGLGIDEQTIVKLQDFVESGLKMKGLGNLKGILSDGISEFGIAIPDELQDLMNTDMEAGFSDAIKNIMSGVKDEFGMDEKMTNYIKDRLEIGIFDMVRGTDAWITILSRPDNQFVIQLLECIRKHVEDISEIFESGADLPKILQLEKCELYYSRTLFYGFPVAIRYDDYTIHNALLRVLVIESYEREFGEWRPIKEDTEIGCVFDQNYENCIMNSKTFNLNVGGSVKVGGILTTLDGEPIEDKTLIFRLAKEEEPILELETDEKGYAYEYWTPDEYYLGKKQYVLEFEGDDEYEPSQQSVTFTVELVYLPITEITYPSEGSSFYNNFIVKVYDTSTAPPFSLDKCYYAVWDENRGKYTVYNQERTCNGEIYITVGEVAYNPDCSIPKTGTNTCKVFAYAEDAAGIGNVDSKTYIVRG